MNSYWIESTKNKGSFNTLEENIDCDVCIIGAGMFGLTTGYYLSKKGLNTIVIDKSEIGKKVSGHTTAKITSQHGLIYTYLANSFSTDFAKKYFLANEEAISNINKIIDTEQINCDFATQNNYIYTTIPDDVEQIKQEVHTVNMLGEKSFYKTNLDLPFEVYGSIMFPNQAMFHPRKYMLGLCNCILQNKGKIFTNTLVHDVKHVDNYYKILTNNYYIKSKYVVLASHYPFINIPGYYFTKMYQETSYIIGIDTKENVFDGMYIGSSNSDFSFRKAFFNNKNILLIGGSNHKTGIENVTYNTTYEILEQQAKKYYPNCDILFRWSTRDCITLDKVPYIGRFSNLLPNMYIGTGFNKWGMTTSNVAANIITDKILGIENKYEDVFTSTRLKPIKNIEEIKNMINQTTRSLVIEKLKIPKETLDNIKNDSGSIIQINNKKIGIYKDSSGNLYAVNPICTHLGCVLKWNNADKTWDCPCHGSRFDYLGNNIYDPAFKPLSTFNL